MPRHLNSSDHAALSSATNNAMLPFLWSDAWLLQAIAVASHAKSATLSEILGAADAVNHALPTDDELHGGFSRLADADYIEEVDGKFRLTDRVPRKTADAIVLSS